MKRFLTTVLGALGVAAAAAGSVDYGYVAPDADAVLWGTAKAEIYNAAIRIDDPSLVGKKVTAVKFMWNHAATAVNCKAFLATELKNVSNVAVGDIAEEKFETPSESDDVVVTLSAPWVVDTPSFYAGYSFRISSLSGSANNYPLVVAPCEDENACFVSTSRTYKRWSTPSNLVPYGLTVSVVVEGEFEADAAGVVSVADVVCSSAEPGSCAVTVANHGLEPLKNIGYTYTVAGKTVSGTYEFETPVASQMYGTKGTVTFAMPAVEEQGEYTGTFTIDKVNGADNSDTCASGTNSVGVAAQAARHAVVMEEFTGTWCQWCTRGLAAMKLLNDDLQDKFIALSYHNGDPMQVTLSLPVNGNGFPGASIDRGTFCDPYYGTTNDTPMGIRSLIDSRLAMAVPANVDVKASYNADQTGIDVEASAYFFKTLQEHPYRLEYVLTADGLTGPADSLGWWQHNAYYRYPATELPGGEQFCKPAEEYIQIPFEDVVVAYSPYAGEPESIPASVEFGSTYEHSYSFDITNIRESVRNGGVPDRSLLQNPDRVYVTVLLLDTSTGLIVNAAKCRVTGAAGVQEVTAIDRTIEAVEYYDLSGRRIQGTPSAGIVIECKRYTDGTRSTARRVVR